LRTEQAGSASSSWGREYDSSGVSPQRMDEAQKHASASCLPAAAAAAAACWRLGMLTCPRTCSEFAVSALQFEDVPTAVKELRLALQLLESK